MEKKERYVERKEKQERDVLSVITGTLLAGKRKDEQEERIKLQRNRKGELKVLILISRKM